MKADDSVSLSTEFMASSSCKSGKRQQAMSAIDMTVMLTISAIFALLVYLNDIPFKIIALGWIGSIAIFIPLGLYNDHKNRIKLKQRYESDQPVSTALTDGVALVSAKKQSTSKALTIDACVSGLYLIGTLTRCRRHCRR
ncbi:MAG: hypothetical protein ACI845_001985 [Gammaproteobacteria bacterium]|jgi:hypothetical protein